MTRQSLARWESALLIGGTWKYSRRWQWRLAWLVDVLHRPAQILLLTGWLLLPSWLYLAFGGITVMLEAGMAQCPLTALADRLRSSVEPEQSRSGAVANALRGRNGLRGLWFTLGFGLLLMATAEIIGWRPSYWLLSR